jgi:putative ATP-dependent endonuclease of OLD family
MFLHPLRDVEQSLNQIRTSPLGRLLAGSDIPQAEQAQLVQILSNANDSISASPTISQIGGRVDRSFAEAAGAAFRMQVELGMSAPSFNDISRSLTILLSNKAMTRFDLSVNGLGLNNVLYVCLLLRVFEERIVANNTPGQLLLFEEPEAHLHSQLQRVLFKSLVGKSFQTIATTHSTHVTSQVPLDSIVVLTDDGSAATASCVPSSSIGLSVSQIADLERYLDATRGILLYARKVMLVEGPAELFLIPPLLKSVLGIDLDENGISVIPIFGVHFDAYTALFGKTAIAKKCAIVADGDLMPSDAAAFADADCEDLPQLIKPNLADLQNDLVRAFVCGSTFERELTSAGTLTMLSAASKEVGAPTVSSGLANIAAGNLSPEELEAAKDLVLRTAKRFGKARFAQIASKHVGLATEVPEYIRGAVRWLLEDEAE